MEPWLSIKKHLKRPLSLFTAVAMMLTTTFSALPVMAEGVPTFAASSTSANPGDAVEITISIENNPGITSAAMDVSFPDELTLTGVSLKRDVYTGQFNGPQSLPVTKKVRLNWANGLADNSTSGLFATLNFSVSESAGEGTYPISITYDPDDVFNLEETNIDFQISNGSVTIGHKLTKTNAKVATCTEPGNSAYWSCSNCGKFFSDEAGNNEITENSWVISAAHTLVKTEAKAATCTEAGSSAYWTCTTCGKYFSDEAGKNEIAKDSWVISAGHNLTKTDAKAATCTEDGNTAYWHCSVCNKYFSDENGTTEIALDDTVVKAHHTMTKTDAKEPTCTADGNNAYYTCSVCGKVFKDEAGTQPTTIKAETLEKKAHTPVVDAAVAATCAKTGLTEGSHCSVCNEVLVAQKVVDKIPHTVVVDAAVEPTYSSTGLTEGKHCSVCNEVIEKQTVIPAKSESNVTVIGDESFAGSKKELADAVLSAEDIENINSGKDITIRLNVALKSDATDAIKEQVKAKLKDYTIGTFYDIDISKSIDGGAPVAVTDTNAPVHIQLTLADSLINTNAAVKRDYKIVRFHYDSVTGQTVVDILDASYHAGYNKLDFNTDKFSVYAVVYKDTEIVATTPTPAPTTKPDSANVDNNNNSNTNNSNSTVEKPSITGKVCPVCGYNNCKLGNDNRWHCGKCAHSWQEYGQAGSTSSTGNAPKSPKTGLF